MPVINSYYVGRGGASWKAMQKWNRGRYFGIFRFRKSLASTRSCRSFACASNSRASAAFSSGVIASHRHAGQSGAQIVPPLSSSCSYGLLIHAALSKPKIIQATPTLCQCALLKRLAIRAICSIEDHLAARSRSKFAIRAAKTRTAMPAQIQVRAAMKSAIMAINL